MSHLSLSVYNISFSLFLLSHENRVQKIEKENITRVQPGAKKKKKRKGKKNSIEVHMTSCNYNWYRVEEGSWSKLSLYLRKAARLGLQVLKIFPTFWISWWTERRSLIFWGNVSVEMESHPRLGLLDFLHGWEWEDVVLGWEELHKHRGNENLGLIVVDDEQYREERDTGLRIWFSCYRLLGFGNK